MAAAGLLPSISAVELLVRSLLSNCLLLSSSYQVITIQLSPPLLLMSGHYYPTVSSSPPHVRSLVSNFLLLISWHYFPTISSSPPHVGILRFWSVLNSSPKVYCCNFVMLRSLIYRGLSFWLVYSQDWEIFPTVLSKLTNRTVSSCCL